MPAVPSPIKLNDVCANLAQTAPQPLTYEGLCSWVEGIDWTQSDWADHVPEVDKEDDYARNILCLEPFEVVVLHWPAAWRVRAPPQRFGVLWYACKGFLKT